MDTQFEPTIARHLGQIEGLDSNAARLEQLKIGDTITAKIYRFDPTVDNAPYDETYRVPYVKWMRVLDVLIHISETLGVEYAHRWYCGVKKCGTCAVRVNGREVLSCWEPAQAEMVIEPLRHLPVVRDLIVDREPYEQRVMDLRPLMVRTSPYQGLPEKITDREMRAASFAMDCINCMACFSACPVLDLGDLTHFAGPAPLVQLAQIALDPRDGLDRVSLIQDTACVFECVSCYRCEEVCPVEIPIVSQIIEPLKAIAFSARPRENKHQSAFMRIVETHGRIDPSELILRTQGLGALARPLRALKLWLNGKIAPSRTFLSWTIPGIEQVRRLFSLLKGS
ncbi:MAG: 2Fe-2S iron-sulfur cluster-binding protein [Xanthobacteraceae bacterium]